MTLLIIGGVGELGQATVVAAASAWRGDVTATYFRSEPTVEVKDRASRWAQLDCANHDAIVNLIELDVKPKAVIYCAVPKHGGAAGKGGDVVRRGIVEDVVAAAESCRRIGSRFVAVSTDQVFDGTKAKSGPDNCARYTEAHPVASTNPYSQYKVAMEKKLMDMSSDIVICRTSLILTLDPPGKGIDFVVKSMKGPDEIILFNDELRNMTFADDLGAGMVELAQDSSFKGIVHLVADEVTNRFDLACLLSKKLGIPASGVKAGLSAESGLNRPLDLSLDTVLVRSLLKTTQLRGVSERLNL